MIRHFIGQGQAIWSPSHGILAGSPSAYFKAHSISEALEIFEQAEFKNCSINAYPRLSRHRTRYPSLLFLDVDDAINLDILLKRIKDKIGGHPTVIETSPGRYHILQPVDAKPLTDLFIKDLAEFPGFAERYFGDNILTCPGHHPTIDSCMLRVPGSINTKSNFQVRIVQEWDGILCSVMSLQLPFTEFLGRKTIRSTDRCNDVRSSGVGYKWIDNILQTPISYGRNIIIWKILAPYLINILKLSEEEALDKIMRWLEKCKVVRSTSITSSVIKSQLRNARSFRDANGKRLRPIFLSKLKIQYENIYNLIVN